MVVIRLARGGSKNRPYYYIHVADSRMRKEGRFIEKLGFYNPMANEKVTKFNINKERLDYWTSVGGKPSQTVKNLIKAHFVTSEVAE